MYSRKQPEQPANQTNTMMETLLREDSQTLRRTNEVLEERVKASTAALKQSNAQLEKEVAERKQTEKRLQRRIAFDQILTAISSRFINLDSDGMDAGINEALADVAAFNQCDCAYIFQLVGNGRILRNTHSWHNNLVNFTHFNDLPGNQLPNWLPRLQNQKIIFAENISEQGLGSEGKIFTQQGIQSALLIPLNFGRETIGLLGIGSHKPASPCQQDTIEAMHMVSIIFVNALMRQKSDERLMAERQRIEATLHTNEQQYKQLVEKATDMIYRINVQGYCTYVNPITIRTMGYTNDKEIIGRHYTEFIHPDFRTMLVNAYHHQQLNQIENSYYEFVAIGKDHKPIWLGQKVQILTEQGQVVGFQALARDITKRRETEEKLRTRSKELNATNAKLAKALRAKDEFLANMSHELRTPLNAILGKAEILLEGIQGSLTEKQQASVQVIEDSGSHLLELINDILDMAKIEAGKINLDIRKVSLINISESSLQFVRQMAHKKQIRLQANIDRSLKTCLSDERRLKQILINLLSNAIKFTPAGGEVGLNILDDSNREAIQFQVWDTGIGISDENMGQLFKPFVQLDSSLDRAHEGTGLGLSLVYRLTEMHGGSVSLESQVGVGSCFTVTLPKKPLLNPAELQKLARTDREQLHRAHFAPQSSTEEPLILLVEVNEASIESVLEYLPVWGYRLSVAHSGQEALQKAHKEQPDIILMGVQIPELDGLTAVRQLRNEEAFDNTPIVTLTALSMPGDRERCLEAGADEYISKPVQLRQLVTTINTLLAQSQLHTKEPGYE